MSTPRPGSARLRNAALAGLLAALALGLRTGEPLGAVDDQGDTITIQLRVWQDVEHDEDIWISARPLGGSWRTLGTVPFPLTHHRGVWGTWYRDLAIAGVEIRITRYHYWSHRVYVSACGAGCMDTDVCSPDGVDSPAPTALELDDGHSSTGHYRYGDLTIAVPLINPQLDGDRDHLLALRDSLAGTRTLNWGDGRELADWTGVTVAGSPPRVTKLELANLGLTGELSGLLGNLTALTTLRLDGNGLTGGIPSRLSQLPRLTHLYLGDNRLRGCIPPSLGVVPNTDVHSLGLPHCQPPIDISYGNHTLTEGTYQFTLSEREPPLIFDVPAGIDLSLGYLVHGDGDGIILNTASGPWLGLNLNPCAGWGRWPRDMDTSAGTLGARFDRIEESRWVGEGAWPPPPDLTVLRVGTPTALALLWEDEPSLAATWQYRWRIRDGTEAAPWSAWTDVPGSNVTTRRYWIGGLDVGGTYEFEVRGRGGMDNRASNTAEATTRAPGKDGIPAIGSRERVMGDGRTEWRVLDSDYVVTVPARTLVAVYEYEGDRAGVHEVATDHLVSFSTITGQPTSWSVVPFSDQIIGSIRYAPLEE